MDANFKKRISLFRKAYRYLAKHEEKIENPSAIAYILYWLTHQGFVLTENSFENIGVFIEGLVDYNLKMNFALSGLEGVPIVNNSFAPNEKQFKKALEYVAALHFDDLYALQEIYPGRKFYIHKHNVKKSMECLGKYLLEACNENKKIRKILDEIIKIPVSSCSF